MEIWEYEKNWEIYRHKAKWMKEVKNSEHKKGLNHQNIQTETKQFSTKPSVQSHISLKAFVILPVCLFASAFEDKKNLGDPLF